MVCVTAVTDEGVVISTWGQEELIRYEDFINAQDYIFTISSVVGE